MSKRFLVYVQERWERAYAVEAETHEEALRIVDNGGGVEVGSSAEYVESLDTDYWQVMEVEGEKAP